MFQLMTDPDLPSCHQVSGFSRVRTQKVGASSCAQDPLGAGQYVFTSIRWLDPDDLDDTKLLASGIKEFLRNHEHLAEALCFDQLINVLRVVVATWRGNSNLGPSPLHHLKIYDEACFLPTNLYFTSGEHRNRVRTRAPQEPRSSQPMVIPNPELHGEIYNSQNCEGLAGIAAIAGTTGSDDGRAVAEDDEAAARFAAVDAQPLLFQPPPSLQHPSLFVARFGPIPPRRLLGDSADSAARPVLSDQPEDGGTFFLADPFPDDCAGLAADEWAVDLPLAGDSDPDGAWATFDALLPHMLRDSARGGAARCI